MTFPVGTEVYRVDVPPVVARGITFSEAELDCALQADVVPLLDDRIGREDLEELLTSLKLTQFGHENVRKALGAQVPVEDWRIGEAVAEAWLSGNHGCSFPWPFVRDLRNPSASPAGADLVGFYRGAEQEIRFAFGEIKTSSERKYPPQVVTSRTGLTRQIERLRDDAAVKHHLVLYLAHRRQGQSWEADFRAAATRFFNDPTAVVLLGVLVRDVAHDEKDIGTRSATLAKDCPAGTTTRVYSLYLAESCLAALPARIEAIRRAQR